MKGLIREDFKTLMRSDNASTKVEGNYNKSLDPVAASLKRGTVEYALNIIRSQYNTNARVASTFNKTFDSVNWNNFNLYDAISGGLLSSSACKYIFYGDVVLNAVDYNAQTEDGLLSVIRYDDLRNPSAGYRSVCLDYSMSGGATLGRVSTVNNAFVNYIQITDTTSASLDDNGRNSIKLEGWLFEIG